MLHHYAEHSKGALFSYYPVIYGYLERRRTNFSSCMKAASLKNRNLPEEFH